MTNEQFCHDFFYRDDKAKRNGNMSWRTVSGKEAHIFSDEEAEIRILYTYDTVLAMANLDQQYIIINNTKYSSRSSTHRTHLMNAIPAYYRQHYIKDVEEGTSIIYFDELIPRLSKILDELIDSKLRREAQRQEFMLYFESLDDMYGDVWAPGTTDISQYRHVAEQISEKIEQAVQRKQERFVKQQEKKAKELKPILEAYPYLDLIRLAFSDAQKDVLSKNMRNILRGYLNPENNLAFIYPVNEDHYYTSRGIAMDARTVHTALKAWKRGKLKHGRKLGPYTVLSVTAEHIVVGCHRFPIENVEAICKEIMPDEN